jgi:hypothetical protein
LPIQLSERSQPERFVSIHFIGIPLLNERVMITRSGIARVAFDGETSDDWRREELRILLNLRSAIRRVQPRPPREGLEWGLRLEQWAPVAGPNAVFNANQSINAGYAVDTFRLDVPDEPKTFVPLEADLAVRDADARLIRVGYYVTIVGRLEEITDEVID